MKKTELRKQYLGFRKSLAKAEVTHKSRLVASNFFSFFDLSQVRCLHVFITIKDRKEVDTSLIIDRVWRSCPHITTVVPRINRREKKMECAVYDPMSRLIPNFWGIFEPLNTRVVPNSAVDAVIVPLIAFDEKGNRVGYGGGYYDKFLALCRDDCLKIGVSLFDPVGEIDGMEDFDVRLDYCVTPDKVWTFRKE